MKVSRNFSVAVQYFLDQWVPPRIRDSKWFMYLPMKLVLKDTVPDFMSFKDTVFTMNNADFSDLYERTAHVQELQGETNLNEACTRAILKTIKNRKVLEVGSGRGYLARKLAVQNKVTACDIILPDNITGKEKDITYVAANIESLPFKDNEFEYVVTTHTLEHVQDLPKAIAELRRVASRKLVVVVPKQRPYKYTFSLHTQFFPYAWSLQAAFRCGDRAEITDLGDWFYVEDLQKARTAS